MTTTLTPPYLHARERLLDLRPPEDQLQIMVGHKTRDNLELMEPMTSTQHKEHKTKYNQLELMVVEHKVRQGEKMKHKTKISQVKLMVMKGMINAQGMVKEHETNTQHKVKYQTRDNQMRLMVMKRKVKH